MYTQDYIRRMINQLLVALQMIIGLKAAGQYGQARQAIDQALEQLLGLKSDLARRLSDEAILDSLRQGKSLDKDRLLILADLFKEDGDVYAALNRPLESFSSHLRALNFYLAAAFTGRQEGGIPEPDDRLEDLYHQLSQYRLPPATLYGLLAYFEETGRFHKAAMILGQLLDEPDIQAEVRREALAFYQRMRAKPVSELEAGELTRSKVEEGLSKFENS